MAAAEFRATLDALGLAQCHLAQLFNVTPRHVRRWKDGSRRLPHAVTILVHLLAAGVITISQVEQAAAVPVPAHGGAEPEPPAPLLIEPAPAQAQTALARVEAATLAQKVVTLAPGACRWPCGDPRDRDFHFCGRPTAAPPYCNEHRIAAHMTPAPVGGQKPSSLAAWPPRTGSRRPSHDVDGSRAAPVALSV
jgi:GcrA cell cycle regulator